MEEKRVFPRIVSDWPLFVSTDQGQKRIGYVKDISLSGALLFFAEGYKLDLEKHKFSIKLKNIQLSPPELILTGLKEWTEIKENEIILGLALDKVEKEERKSFIHFLSRSDKLQVEVFIVEDE